MAVRIVFKLSGTVHCTTCRLPSRTRMFVFVYASFCRRLLQTACPDSRPDVCAGVHVHPANAVGSPADTAQLLPGCGAASRDHQAVSGKGHCG